MAAVVSERLINPSIRGFLQLPDEYEIAEIKAPRNCFGRSLRDISLGSKYELRLITIRREFEEEVNGEKTITEHIIGVPQPETKISSTDTLVVFGPLKSVKKFLEINE